MAKLILSVSNAVVREVALAKEIVTIGRRPDNDIFIDSPGMSDEHAVIVTRNELSFLEERSSRTGAIGAQVNGKPIKKHQLRNGDLIELGQYKLRYVADSSDAPTVNPLRNMVPTIRVLNGVHSGTEIALNRTLTTLGRPGEQVAAITRQSGDYFITHIEGDIEPAINGVSIGAETRKLEYGDVISLAGTMLAFLRA